MIQLTDKLFALPIEENAWRYEYNDTKLYYRPDIGKPGKEIEIGFNYQILGTVSKDTIDFDVACLYNISPKAFRSLLISKGCNPDEKHLIIEKI